MTSLEKFRAKYQYFNEQTLLKATQEDSELLKELVLDNSLAPLAKAYVIDALAWGSREEYFAIIKDTTDHANPLLRESAYLALYEFYNLEAERHLELKDLFKACFRRESTHVKETLKNLLFLM